MTPAAPTPDTRHALRNDYSATRFCITTETDAHVHSSKGHIIDVRGLGAFEEIYNTAVGDVGMMWQISTIRFC